MAYQGAGWIPSSVVGRAIKASEDQLTWTAKFSQSTRLLLANFENPYLVCLTGFLVFAGFQMRRRPFPLYEMLIVAPIVGLYTAFPPGVYMPRYLIPVVPVTACVTLLLLRQGLRKMTAVFSRRPALARAVSTLGNGKNLFVCALAAGWIYIYAPWTYGFYRVTQEEVLLPGLAGTINQLAKPEDKVLVYEIQSQFI
ncbi:MAG: hypothetical protein GWM98_19255 [Nitrospinaceae bacterium]|nr:hypothetical protein [Nitrospinaceae bacterium]NIR56230.1 hypothetical protein [Nitrospinaceae bacterium]NIS86686.1 hypothetical protein [Nitrospinaceae bacterium]NIT83519.1 hypothetical protein [Nitrospinaceae bacterium]NIU45724.1 hypothetical protein [Nitrospinaceae bacterium]